MPRGSQGEAPRSTDASDRAEASGPLGASDATEVPEDAPRRRARRELLRAAGTDPARPGFHFRPPAGWMNDPNGTIHHRGRYHLFYQHNPYADTWGNVHWGHARSRDLVEWEHLPLALAPAADLGEGHCFSGCAAFDDAGRALLLYSSVPEREGDRPFEVWAARGDEALRRFRRVPENPLLAPGALRAGPDPGGGPPRFSDEWRDPFVVEAGGGTFLVLGASLPDEANAPVIPLFEAEDGSLLRWRYRGLLHRDDPADTAFFECPNLLALEGRHYLLHSPHRPVEWVSGRFDPEAARFDPDGSGRVDHGHAFYATSPFVDGPAPSPVLVGWVRGWTPGRGWNGVLSLPRVLSAGDAGRLRQRPHPGLRALREGPPHGIPPGTRVEGSAVVPAPPTCQLEARIALDPGGSGVAGFRLRRAEDGVPVAEVRVLGRAGPVEVEALRLAYEHAPGEPPAAATGRAGRTVRRIECPRRRDGRWEVRAFWDRSLLELFLDDGRAVFTEVLDAEGEDLRVEILADGDPAQVRSAEVWRLRGIW